MTEQFPRYDLASGAPLSPTSATAMTETSAFNHPPEAARFDPMTGQMIPAAVAPPVEPVFTAAVPPPPAPIPLRMTRAQVMEIRRREREQGIDFPLTQTSKEAGYPVVAKVRDLPFTDRMMLMGVPVELRASLNSAMGLANAGDIANVGDVMAALESMDEMAKALCCAGFIWPRIVLHDYQLDGTDDCWLADDLHADERAAYRDLVMRKGEATSEVERLATFPDAEVAQAPAG